MQQLFCHFVVSLPSDPFLKKYGAIYRRLPSSPVIRTQSSMKSINPIVCRWSVCCVSSVGVSSFSLWRFITVSNHRTVWMTHFSLHRSLIANSTMMKACGTTMTNLLLLLVICFCCWHSVIGQNTSLGLLSEVVQPPPPLVINITDDSSITILPPAEEEEATTTLGPLWAEFSEVHCSGSEECPPSAQCVGGMCQCSPDHCQNNAVCVIANSTTIVCSCSFGFSGEKCEFKDQSCGNFACKNGGSCYEHVNCLCPNGMRRAPVGRRGDLSSNQKITPLSLSLSPTGYTGDNCEHRDLSCHKCVNGTCHTANGTSTCICNVGFEGKLVVQNFHPPLINFLYTGDNCDQNIDDCKDNPCLNGAICRDLIADFHCECQGPHSGKLCEKFVNPCDSSPCLNSATCYITPIPAPDGSHYKCACAPGFTGRLQSTFHISRFVFVCSGNNCQVNIDDCVNHECPTGQVCVDQVNSYSCACPPGYQGDTCEKRIDHCQSNSCDKGTCVNGLTNYTCNCSTGYTGVHCELDIDECQTNPCKFGICVNTNGSFNCYCTPGFTGTLCHIDIDECLSQPCKNNATCQNLHSSYKCDCLKGYTGQDCEHEIDECSSSPCLNGGSCVDGLGEFQCQCAEGFDGPTCANDIDECKSSPCLHNSTCVNKNGRYECICLAGFAGLNCETDIDECGTNPCQNNGTCLDLVGKFQCKCLDGFEGERCEVNIDECNPSPCLNGGICIDQVNAYLCDCTDTGFEGEHCEHNIDDCNPNPCNRGTRKCEDGVQNYTCHCYHGFTGRNCEIDIDECSSSPCLNGATCQEKSHENLFNQSLRDLKYDLLDVYSLGYSCICASGFEGISCQINKNDCEIHSCQNGGTCIDEVNSYSCKCPPEFEGRKCQFLVDPCYKNECRNGATCK